jgi:endonuclease YncB( thermonuclease family)
MRSLRSNRAVVLKGKLHKYWRILLSIVPVSLMLCPDRQAAAQSLGGYARVNGDTIEFDRGIRVRLWGIDAPEGDQLCYQSSGVAWDCGLAAKQFLEARVSEQSVACRPEDVDRYGRIVAECFVNQISLNSALVEAGLALAYRHFTGRFVPEENHAASMAAGMWAGSFIPPWDWRAADRAPSAAVINRQAGSPSPDPACAIKGNINARGAHIYHRPGQADYSATVITEARGERWFCSAEEAEAAGWRAARR